MRPEEITMQWVALKCDEDGDCLLWNLSCNACGQPRYSFTRVEGKGRTSQMRRHVWKALCRPKLAPNQVVTTTCGHPRCLAPAHLAVTTRREVIVKMSARPDVKARKLVAGAAYRRPLAKLNLAQVAYIRQSDKTLAVLAGELGVSTTWVSRVRRNEAWKEFAADPFAGLGSR